MTDNDDWQSEYCKRYVEMNQGEINQIEELEQVLNKKFYFKKN